MKGIQFEKTLSAVFPAASRPLPIAQVERHHNVPSKTVKDESGTFTHPSHDSGQSDPELQVTDQSPAPDRRQMLPLVKPESDSTECHITPAELYGCLCHKR